MERFTILDKLPSFNDYINATRKNKYSGAKLKSQIDEICGWYIKGNLNALKKACFSPVVIYFEWHEKTKRRDIDNVYSAKKFILDALQKCEVLKNDSPAYVLGTYDSVVYDNTNKVVVSIIPITEYHKLQDLFDVELERLKKELESEKRIKCS